MGNLDFVAIDLETATSHRNSICEIGILKNSIVIYNTNFTDRVSMRSRCFQINSNEI